MAFGTRLRHFNGHSLAEVERMLEFCGYKTDVVAVNRTHAGEWFIHFTVSDMTYLPENKQPKVEKTEETKTIKKGNK